jgi:hypothetical protein
MLQMEQKPELRLPTQAVHVRVALQGQEAVEGELFVAELARSGTQLLDDVAALLDEQAPFLPLRLATGVRLYGKQAITWVSLGHQVDDLALVDRLHRVAITLVSGETIGGTLFDSSPADRPRVADHINTSTRFVRLWTQSDHYLINKSQILHVSEQ